MNDSKLAMLQTEGVTYAAADSGAEAFLDVLKRSCPARQSLTLKVCRSGRQLGAHPWLQVGAQVVLLKNVAARSGLYNGARGVVVAFAPAVRTADPKYPVVRFTSGVTRVIERKHGTGGGV